PVSAQSGPPSDTESLRARWPDVLEAVQGKKRVAWIQLSNATVDSFSDGQLTLAFAQAGMAKGFVAGGYDKDLGQVLADLFGLTPQIKTVVVTAGAAGADIGAGTGSSPPPPARQPESRGTPSPADGNGDRGAPRRSQPAGSQQDRPPGPVLAQDAESEPEPTDLPAPDVLTGTGLIERELGGRVIQELDGP
ncbi:MAG: hypothetical protein WAL16_02000, partial [Streptosporangiaceae bacterium]